MPEPFDLSESAFVVGFDVLSSRALEIATEHGWATEDINDGLALMLMVSELAEALEALRVDETQSKHIDEYSAVEEELADVIIRIMNYGFAKNYHIGEAVVAKMRYNKQRPYKHGGKKF